MFEGLAHGRAGEGSREGSEVDGVWSTWGLVG